MQFYLFELQNYKLVKKEDLDFFSSINENPNALTDGHMHLIAKNYLSLYPKSRHCSFFALHTNQDIAKEMGRTEFNSAEARWSYLQYIYKQLPNTDGKLANTIKNLFSLAFNQRYHTSNAFSSPFGVHVANYEPADVASHFGESIKEYYSHRGNALGKR